MKEFFAIFLPIDKMSDNTNIIITVLALVAAILLVSGIAGKKTKEGFWAGIGFTQMAVTDTICAQPGASLTSVLPKNKFFMVPSNFQASPAPRMAPAQGIKGQLAYGMNRSETTQAFNPFESVSAGCPTQACVAEATAAKKATTNAKIIEAFQPGCNGQFSASKCDESKGMAGYQTGASYAAALASLPQSGALIDGVVSTSMDTVDALGNCAQVYTVKNLMTTTLRGGRYGYGRDYIRGDLGGIAACNRGWFYSAPTPAALSKGALWAMGGTPEVESNNGAALASTLAAATLGTNSTVSGVGMTDRSQAVLNAMGDVSVNTTSGVLSSTLFP